MPRTTGAYVITSAIDEPVRAFVPSPLPPVDPPLAQACYAEPNRLAELALARLGGVAGLVPSVEWLLYGAIRKEALLTSQIEGTQATLADLLDNEAGFTASSDDVLDVTNYLRAFQCVQDNLHRPDGLPVSVRLLCEAHRLLLAGARGTGRQPGELRHSQNWIGGTRPGNAAFVPPPPEQVPGLLADLEAFIHADTDVLPPLVRIALVHAQFETIHPFLDGNGRIGRLLIAALMDDWQLLPQPLVYLSGYLKQHQAEYYRRLTAIRDGGDWETWVVFFLEGVTQAAGTAERHIITMASQIASDRKLLLQSSRIGPFAYRLFEMLPLMPRFTVDGVRQQLNTSFPTASATVSALEELGIIREITGQRKNRTYSYQAYIDLLMQ